MERPSEQTILVTGATGNVGRYVVKFLLQEFGMQVRATGMDLERARREFEKDELGLGLEELKRLSLVKFDYLDPSTYRETFCGITSFFLIRPPHLGDAKKQIIPAVAAALDAGVKYVVFLSVQGAANNPSVPHYDVEQFLVQQADRGRCKWTMLRASFFMQNLSTTHANDIAELDSIIVPAGSGRTAFVDCRDVAYMAAVCLSEGPEKHGGQGYTPTSEDSFTYDDVATVISDAIGRKITYTNPFVVSYCWHMSQRRGMPLGMVAVTTVIYSIARFGYAGDLTDDFQRVTGKKPLTLKQFALDHAKCWEKRSWSGDAYKYVPS